MTETTATSQDRASRPTVRPLPQVRHPALDGLLEGLTHALIPATTPTDDESPDDYRRIVIVIAALAVGFFGPSLVIAGVPGPLWIPFTAVALIAAFVLAGSFIRVPRGSPLVVPSVVLNAFVVAMLGVLYRPYFHEVALLVCLLVAAHAILHGFGPAMVLVAIGSVLIPLAIQDPAQVNPTDIGYAAIYLGGVAAIPWAASHVARGRLVEVRRNLQAITETQREAVLTLARAAEAKDDVTGGHVLRVGEIAAQLAEATGATPAFIEDIRFAAMLHDVGKLHVPDRILMKSGPLDPEEWEIIRRHAIWGERILGSTDGFELSRRVARSHHENWDGTGYPDGRVGTDTPLAARIVHIADVFDALRTPRPYKDAWPLERCLDEIAARSGRMFDPDLVAAFLGLAAAGSLPTSVDHPAPTRHPSPGERRAIVAGTRRRRPAADPVSDPR